MSVQSCTAFFEQARMDPALEEMLRAVTDTRELVALGYRNGYRFGVSDLVTASTAIAGQDEPRAKPTSKPAEAPPVSASSIYHYELDLLAIPEMAAVVDELPQLTIKPPTIDLEQFGAAFRQDDLDWTSVSPADPGFRERYEQMMAAHWNGADTVGNRRDFHLINLDRHVDHSLYDSYLQAKVRMVRHLSDIFRWDIRFSGSMWYPPRSYRLWHTNENQPGWRMYLIDFDAAIAESDMRSFFRYMNPATKELVTLQDRPKLLRFFKVDQSADALFWHCIVNSAERNRWSFGFVIPDDWMTRLRAIAPGSEIGHDES
jgi:hypothetical protein